MAQNGCVQAAYQLPGGTPGHRGPIPTTQVNSSLSLLCVSEVLFHLALDCAVFLGDSDTKMHWEEVFGFLFPVIGDRGHFPEMYNFHLIIDY